MDPSPSPPPPQSTDRRRSWSIYGRPEITERYEILGRIGSGAYADVYRGRRLSDGLAVALKEIHDYQSSFREIEALQALRGSPNVAALLEYFWSDSDEDAVLVLEYLPSDLASVIRQAKKRGDGAGIGAGEVKRWMQQILRGVDDCHRLSVVHRDLKPSNLLISEDGTLKLADFGQARILQELTQISIDNSPLEPGSDHEMQISQQDPIIQEVNKPFHDGSEGAQELKPIYEDDYLREVDGLKAKYPAYDTDKETLHDGDVSCLATCSTGDLEDDPFKGSTCSFEVTGLMAEDESGGLTSCVGTRWYRAPELLYGSTSYGIEIDLWSLGCIFGELLSLEPLFPGTSDLEQIAKIVNVLGDMNEDSWPGCSKLPDYNKISFSKVENPVTLERCLPNQSPAVVNIIRKLLCYDPTRRTTAAELLGDGYFSEDPLPVPLNELAFPSTRDADQYDSSDEEWGNNRRMDSDSEFEDYGKMDVVTTDKGFSLEFSD